MSKHRPSTSQEFVRVLEPASIDSWQSGCHKTYKMPDGNLITLPVGHGNGKGKELSKGLRCHLLKVCCTYGLLVAILAIGIISLAHVIA